MTDKIAAAWLHGWQLQEILSLKKNESIRELTMEGNHFTARSDGKGHFQITLEVEL
jgi:hypothetical protein